MLPGIYLLLHGNIFYMKKFVFPGSTMKIIFILIRNEKVYSAASNLFLFSHRKHISYEKVFLSWQHYESNFIIRNEKVIVLPGI